MSEFTTSFVPALGTATAFAVVWIAAILVVGVARWWWGE